MLLVKQGRCGIGKQATISLSVLFCSIKNGKVLHIYITMLVNETLSKIPYSKIRNKLFKKFLNNSLHIILASFINSPVISGSLSPSFFVSGCILKSIRKNNRYAYRSIKIRSNISFSCFGDLSPDLPSFMVAPESPPVSGRSTVTWMT